MTQFFGNNFTEDRWRKAALKNAFSLLGKQRFEHSAAFFLLAGHLKDAVEVMKFFMFKTATLSQMYKYTEGGLHFALVWPLKLLMLSIFALLSHPELMTNTKPSSLHSDSFLAVILVTLQSDMGNCSALRLRGLPTINFLSDCLPSPI